MASKIEVDEIFNAGGDNDTGIDLATNDQILLKVANSTKLTMNATGQTTIVGEGGTTTTSLQQGLVKVWIQLNGTGTIATQDSLNIGSITDVGTGNYRTTFTNNMNNDDFSTWASGNAGQNTTEAVTTSTLNTLTANSAGSLGDVSIVVQGVAGDLA